MKNSNQAEMFPVSAQQSLILQRMKKLGRPLTAHIFINFDEYLVDSRVEHVVRHLCERHEILRTQYKHISGMSLPIQEICSDARFIIHKFKDEQQEQAKQHAVSKLEQVPVVVAQFDQKVLISTSLASMDEVSLRQIGSEFQDLYKKGFLNEFDGLQYADYAAWQADLGEEDIGKQGREFWTALYTEYQTLYKLPFERNIEYVPEVEQCSVSADLVPYLTELGKKTDLSIAEILLFLWGMFLARLGEQAKFLIASNIDRRNEQLRETVGYFISPLLVAFEPQLQHSIRENIESFSLQLKLSRSWEDCLNELDMFGLHAMDDWPISYGFSHEVAHKKEKSIHTETDDILICKLHLKSIEDKDELKLQLCYQPGLFPREVVEEWLDQFIKFARNAAIGDENTVEKIKLVDSAKLLQLYEDFDRTQALLLSDNTLLHHLFEYAADKVPDRVAVQVGENKITYAELDQRANQLAHVLRMNGVDSDHVVAVYGERSIDMIVALLGILKAGGAYLPLDPAYPSERLSFMLEDAKVGCLIALQPINRDVVLISDMTTVYLDDCLKIDAVNDNNTRLPLHKNPDNLAYVIYTSGSTGQPKGVMISHKNACASTEARFKFYHESIQHFLMLSSFSFDSSVAGIFWTLGQGGTLHLPVEGEHQDPNAIASIITQKKISHVLVLPSFYLQILENLNSADLTCVIVAGESCPVELVHRHQQKLLRTMLVNEYGPTEGTVWSSAFIAPEKILDERVPIGEPITGARLIVLDSEVEPVALGQAGELCVGGDGLARGYLNRPELTAQRFIPDPFSKVSGQRLYRTGDLVRRWPKGPLDFLERMDFQVKIRGYRIELGEIEACLLQQEGVSEAAVIVRETSGGEQVAAYVVMQSIENKETVEQALLAELREKLPSYMVPAVIRVIERLPRSPNGKLNRMAFNNIEMEMRDYLPPRTELEATLVAIWQDILRKDRIGVHDNFFALGGHSLLATRVRYRIQTELGVTLSLRALLESETIEMLARQIESHRDSRMTDSNIESLEALFDSVEEK